MGERVDALVRKLQTEGETAQARLAALPQAAWAVPIYTEGQVWQARDILAHLVSAERGHQMLIADVARGGSGAPAGLDVDCYNRSQVAALADRAPSDLLADLQAVRAGTIALVAGLADDDLARRGNHPALGENAPLADFIRIVFMHVRMHLRDLSRVLTDAKRS